MQILKRSFYYIFLLAALNQVLLYTSFPANILLKVLAGLFCQVFFIFYLMRPLTEKQATSALTALSRSYELLLATAVLFTGQTLLDSLFFIGIFKFSFFILVVNSFISFLLLYLLAVNALIRSFIVSRQISLTFRIILLISWWFPLVNIVAAFVASRRLGAELRFTRLKYQRNLARKAQQVCQTKYPLVMIHGIFFRDWELFNYWGRIPKELEINGAKVFYGGHPSSLPVVESAQELKERILAILAETGAEKVNIIAHSKGGIDSRYAISCLGLAPYVASLTTINTPHLGSDLAGKVLEMTPKKAVTALGKQYAKLFTHLGDASCDFAGSVTELTPERCRELNQQMPDSEQVFYQSAGSQMTNWRSAPFPLNMGYSIIYPIGGANDGLVATRSMTWGNFIGIQTGSGKRGISHGDMIDLTRLDIPGFDVTEFYVKLVNSLKTRGL